MAKHRDEGREPDSFRLGRVILTVELAPDGARIFGMNINVSDAEDEYIPTKEYDVHAMLGFATVNLADREWRELAYPEADDGNP